MSALERNLHFEVDVEQHCCIFAQNVMKTKLMFASFERADAAMKCILYFSLEGGAVDNNSSR